MQNYYRPEWVSGRYNANAQIAIAYNLVEGQCHLFENLSALIIGEILSVDRGGEVSLARLGEMLEIPEASLSNFAQELCRLGLLLTKSYTPEEILTYRQTVAKQRASRAQTSVKTTEEKLPRQRTNPEMIYSERVGGVFSMMFELTYTCTEKCLHCYNIGAERNEAEQSQRDKVVPLALADYKRIIDDLYDEGLVKVCLSGGDPFSNRDAWDILDYLYSKGIVIDVYTNGQRILRQVGRLASSYPRIVGVSIYSGTAEDHDYITRLPGSWERSMQVVRTLAGLGVPLQLKCCVMRPNLKTYYQVADIARELGAQAQFELNVSDSVEGDQSARQLRLRPEQLELVLRDDNTPMYVGKEAPNYGGQSRLMDNNACGAGYNSFCLKPDGGLIPCCAFHLPLGNLRTQRMREVLETSGNLREWQGLKLSDYEECGQHDYCAYCNLCVGHAYSEHQSIIKASENCCYMAKARHSLAQRMMMGYDPLAGQSLQYRLAELPQEERQTLRRVFARPS